MPQMPLFTRRHAVIMLSIFALLAGVYWFTYSGTIFTTDERFLFDAVESLVRRQNTRLNLSLNFFPFKEYTIGDQPFAPLADAEPMQIFAASLLFAAAEAVPGIGLVHAVWLLNVLVCAAGGAVFFLYARSLGYSERVGAAGAVMYGLGTIAWPYSKVFFREPLAMVLLFSAALCLNVWRRRWGTARSWGWLGGFIVLYLMALLTKEAALLSIPIFVALAVPWVSWRRLGMILLIGILAVGFIAVALNIVLNVVSVPRTYNPFVRLQTISGNAEIIGYAFLSYLVSPGRSIFTFSPVLLLGIPGVWLLMRARRWREALIPVLTVLTFAAGYAALRNVHWFGGRSWGPRYMVPATIFAMLAVLPVLQALSRPDASRWARRGAAAIFGIGIWAQLNGVVLPQWAYADEVARRGVLEWADGTWNLIYTPIVISPQLWGQVPVDFAWLRVGTGGLWLAVAAAVVAVGAAWALWHWLRQRQVTRRGLQITSAALLLGMIGAFYVGLRSIYNDPYYLGNFPELRTLTGMLEEETRPDDILVLANPTYQDYFLNYWRNGDVLVYTLPTAPGEQPSPAQPPGVVSDNPDMLLQPRHSIFLNNLPEYTDRVWLLNSSGPFTTYTIRPVEWFMARHYFPVKTLQTDESTRAILFSVNSDAPPIPAMAWPEHPVDARFGDSVELVGYDLPPARVRVGPFPGPDPARTAYLPGDVVPVSLLWRALQRPARDYNIGIFVIDANGAVAAQRDTPPQATFRPMDSWRAGELVRDNHGLQLPADLPPGSYQLWVKVYAWQTGEPLPVTGADRVSNGQAALLTVIEVAAE